MSTAAGTHAGERGAVPPADPWRYGWRYVLRPGPDGSEIRERIPLTQEDVLHPQEEDFIVQNAAHDRDCHYLRNVLQAALADRPDALVLHDVRVDWGVEGVEPHGPDLAAFLQVPPDWNPRQGTLAVAEVGAQPLLVIEVTSPATRDIDLNDKVEEYYKAGVPFYVIVDTRASTQGPQTYGIAYQRMAEGYCRLVPNERGWLWIEPLKRWLAGEAERVRCYDEHGDLIADYPELSARTLRAETLAEEERRARREVEARVETLDKSFKEAESQVIAERRRVDELLSRLTEAEEKLRHLESEHG